MGEEAAVAEEAIAERWSFALERIPDERGTIMHMLKSTDEHFVQFGEIYFTTIYRDVGKGLAQAPGDDAQLRLHLRSRQARPRRLADQGYAPGDLPRA
jgi:dTDP-4-dehydrorhamnose 3,5-epimerase-like enzyme